VSQFKQDFSVDYKENYWSTIKAFRQKVEGAEYVSYLTKFWKNYGKVGLTIHASMYFTTIGACYVGISHMGGGEQALQYLKMIPWPWLTEHVSNWSPNASALAMSVLIAESTDILRAPITVLLARAYKKRRDNQHINNNNNNIDNMNTLNSHTNPTTTNRNSSSNDSTKPTATATTTTTMNTNSNSSTNSGTPTA
jgi:hypothetical protein